MDGDRGADRTPRLRIDAVPASSWGANLSRTFKGRGWDVLRRETYRRAGNCCEICGGQGTQHPVEAHEVWRFDEETGIQSLVRLIALCPSCHEVVHFGRTVVTGRADQAIAHLAKVNRWTLEQAKDHAHEAAATLERRSSREWKIDLSILANYGITPPTDSELQASAERTRSAIRAKAANRPQRN